MSSPAWLSLSELSASIRDGAVSSFEATQACLESIYRLQPELHCFIEVEADAALAAARRADAEIAKGQYRGPLHGVPLAHKDIFLRQGRASTGGSTILRQHVGEATATVVDRLDQAGAINLGALNMAEFAGNPTGHNPHFGDCRNPWNVERITGGSSSGSAAAVAARLSFASLGTDTGGSVRTPAAMCGVCGLKPTYGRISRAGVIPRAWSLDTVGVLARTAEDCALVTRVVAGHDAHDATTARLDVPDYRALLAQPVRGLRIGIPSESFLSFADQEVRLSWRRNLTELSSLGIDFIEVALPELSNLAVVADAITKCEAAAVHDRWIRSHFGEYSMFVRSRLEAGFHIPAARYLQAIASRGPVLERFMSRIFGAVDAIHLPVTPVKVPTIATTDIESPGQVPQVIANITALTRPFNYLGLPAISVPSGFDADGLPSAFQLVGRPFAEALLLNVAHVYQQVFSWHRRVPPLVARQATPRTHEVGSGK